LKTPVSVVLSFFITVPSEDEEIEETILHELRHHVESLAGIDDLSVEEMLELQDEYFDEGN